MKQEKRDEISERHELMMKVKEALVMKTDELKELQLKMRFVLAELEMIEDFLCKETKPK